MKKAVSLSALILVLVMFFLMIQKEQYVQIETNQNHTRIKQVMQRKHTNSMTKIIANHLMNNELYINSSFPVFKFKNLNWNENPYNNNWQYLMHSLDMIR